MLLVDVIIIGILVCGVLLGFKRGVFKSAVTFVGAIIVFVLAFQLKNPVSNLMSSVLPFFQFGNMFKGITVINILLYEIIAFLLVFAVLYVLLKIIIKITGIFEKILKMTIVLGIPSKILGAIFGFFESYIYVYVILFVISCLSFSIEGIDLEKSSLAPKILNDTPFVSNIADDGYQAVQEIYSLKDKYQTSNAEEFNEEALAILLKYGIISPENALKLNEKGKIKIPDINEIISQYKEANK